METVDFRQLVVEDELFVRDGSGTIVKSAVVKFLAGPFLDGEDGRQKWVAVVRDAYGFVINYNISDLAIKPQIPEAGQTWTHRTDYKTRYVAGVTDKYVIVKSSAGRPDNTAFVLPLSDFTGTYTKRP